MTLFYEVVVYVNICRICHCHFISAVLTCDRAFKNYLPLMFNGCNGQSGSVKSGLVFCLISGVRFMFIGWKVVASNAGWDTVTGKDYEKCEEMFSSQNELQISLHFQIGADTFLLQTACIDHIHLLWNTALK